MQELKGKPVLRRMMESSMFERYVFLESGREPGHIGRVVDGEGREIKAGRTGC